MQLTPQESSLYLQWKTCEPWMKAKLGNTEIGFLQAEKDIREGKQGTGSTLYGIVTGMKSDMSGTGKQIERFLKLVKEGCVITMVFQMVVVFILPHAAIGPDDPRKDVPL